ncbi:hypothetical protein M409DRAFT_66936 [Zasmidium cellare ATCC 36951]|uniref:Small ribosomal subunit protein uS5m n=1 Tax=Zasmidium cellare ATCC 36951 TaxID=1080233 RepID=A0A6A6CFW9_ZASCE|nr:uncharacterized protein M409DRAFT_66936 [Zasmidium cellare ATCC 36951]KAF2166045.1 hypothetical protein M409DRAFT_66936 [Zasmidium cellare ATCC 36951]
MSSSKTYQCLSCRIKSVVSQTVPNARRSFHTTPANQLRKRPNRKYPNIKAEDMGVSEARQTEVDSLASHLKPYTEREKRLLARKYTPEQMKAIEEGEKAIDPTDMMTQGRFRTDPMRIDYIDDFATQRPGLDRLPSTGAPLEEGFQPLVDAMGGSRPQSSKSGSKQDQEEEDPRLLRLSQQTGLTKEAIRKIRVKNLVSHRVVNQTRMGKIQSLYFLTIAGNQDGMLGIGEGKAAEDEDGRRQAMMNAIRNMKPIPRYEERTIFGEVEGKVGASIVKLSSRPPGFGNRCQHLIFELARAAGISDLAARTPRSRNKMNVVKAAFQALTNQRLPEEIARARGRKMVDVRGVYYGGLVH